MRQQTRFEKDRKEAETFQSGDKGDKGITTLASGLKYKVIKKGNGGKPKSTDKVAVHYRIMRLDGAELDSTYRRGRPETLQINEIIPGLMEALVLMEEGSKWEIFIPPALSGGQFGKEVTVLFEVELLSIQGKK